MTPHVISLIFLTCLTLNVFGTKIVLESSPNDIKDGLARTLTLRCSLHDTAASANIVGRRDVTLETRDVTQTADNVEEVSSLIIMRNGQDIASISHSHGAHVMDGETNLRVAGSVDGSLGGEGYIELTFDYPTVNNSGEFVCEASTVRQGHAVQFSTSAEVGFSTPTMVDLVDHIRQNQQRIDQLENVTKTAVLFSAVMTHTQVVPDGQAVKYDTIYTNLGNGYNQATGEFVCSVPGYYSFSFGTHINSVDPHLFFHLVHNTERVLCNYATIHNGDQEMAFNSVIRKLAAGDVVKVVSMGTSSIFSSDRDRYTSFSGHLVALV